MGQPRGLPTTEARQALAGPITANNPLAPLVAQRVRDAAMRQLPWASVLQELKAATGLDDDLVLKLSAAQFAMRPMLALDLQAMEPAFDVISYVEAGERQCAAFRLTAQTLLIAVADPIDQRLRLWLDRKLRKAVFPRIEWGLTGSGHLQAFLAGQERNVRAMDSVAQGSEGKASEDQSGLRLSLTGINSDESMVVRVVNSTIYDALAAEASDIHLESGPTGMAIKCRVDGVLSPFGGVDGSDTAAQVISRIKVLADLDISERRVPQDGRLKVHVRGRDIDLRVSIMPNLHGEDAVLRILDRAQLTAGAKDLTLKALGFDAQAMAFIKDMGERPYGLLLVTGPTGSGKTTTLYAVLSEINTGLDKIVTIEDPVEYQIPGILQIPVNEAKGLTFARGLRSLLRHDPDKILVGEIRDPETAQIAAQAALTGHQVFTSVHANNVFDVMGRFANMDVDIYSFVAALNGIVAQRLVRLNCPKCLSTRRPSAALLEKSRLTAEHLSHAHFQHGTGCPHCRGTGFKGRRAIAETLAMTDELRDLLSRRASIRELREAGQRAGLRTLRAAAVDLVLAGHSTLEEINRVTTVDH